MNQRFLEELARQRMAEARRIAGGYECRSPAAAAPARGALARTGPPHTPARALGRRGTGANHCEHVPAGGSLI
jgi:hypothetical protein